MHAGAQQTGRDPKSKGWRHAHLILTEGESVRLADAISGKGVMPLA
jgi:ligand-binding SRPBCC domain-containing protein